MNLIYIISESKGLETVSNSTQCGREASLSFTTVPAHYIEITVMLKLFVFKDDSFPEKWSSIFLRDAGIQPEGYTAQQNR
jgi:hypothetical protein